LNKVFLIEYSSFTVGYQLANEPFDPTYPRGRGRVKSEVA